MGKREEKGKSKTKGEKWWGNEELQTGRKTEMMVKLHISQTKVGAHTNTHTCAHPPTPIQIGGALKHAKSNLIKTSLS